MARVVVRIRASSLPSYLGHCELSAAVGQLGDLFIAHGYQIRPPRPNVGALVGTGLHEGGRLALTERMDKGTLTPLDAMTDASIGAFRDRREKEIAEGRGSSVLMDEDTPSMDAAERQIVRMCGRYRLDVVIEAQPLSVENRLEVEAMPGVILSGQSDLLHLDSQAAANVVRDLKTSRRKATPLKHLAQIGAYSLLFRSEGHETHGAQIDHLPRTRMDREQLPVEAHKLDVAAAEQIAAATVKDFGRKALAFAEDGDPTPFLPNPASQLCSPKFCRAFGCGVCSATRNQGAPRA